MNAKLIPAFEYECFNKLKAMTIFFSIKYTIFIVAICLIELFFGQSARIAGGMSESTIIFIAILGILGYREDYKALMQNGYTRKSIFLATEASFLACSLFMNLVDQVFDFLFSRINMNVTAVFQWLYGEQNGFITWIWLSLLSFLVCNLFYFLAMIINRTGKKGMIYLFVFLMSLIFLGGILIRFVLPTQMVASIFTGIKELLGIYPDTIQIANPILFFIVLSLVFALGSFLLIRKSEL